MAVIPVKVRQEILIGAKSPAPFWTVVAIQVSVPSH